MHFHTWSCQFHARHACMIIHATCFFSRSFLWSKKCPTRSVTLFSQTTNLTLIGPLFTETITTTPAKSGQCKQCKGSPFHFLLFKRNLQNRTKLKVPPFTFFCTMRHFPKEKTRSFFKIFFCSQLGKKCLPIFIEHERHPLGVSKLFWAFHKYVLGMF